MKRLFFLLCFFFPFAPIYAQQWHGDTTATATIYRFGKVGIGLTAPQHSLHIQGTIQMGGGGVHEDLILYADTPLAGYNGTFTFIPRSLPGSGINKHATYFKTADSPTAGATRHDLIVDGRIGVGLTNPTAALEVNGETHSTTLHVVNRLTMGDGSPYNDLYLETGLPLTGYNGTFSLLPRSIPGSGLGKHATHFKTADSPTAGATRHDVLVDGRVGIGTPTPDYLLHIEGTGQVARIKGNFGSTALEVLGEVLINDNNDAGLRFNGGGGIVRSGNGLHLLVAGTPLLTLPNGGNKVGIGTTSPLAKLHVQDGGIHIDGGSEATLDFYGKFGSTNNRKWRFSQGGGTPNYFALTSLNDDNTVKFSALSFSQPNGTTSDFNVGIGVASPQVKLDVRDTKPGATMGVRFWNETTNTDGTETRLDFPVFNGTSGLSIRSMGSSNGGYNVGTYDGWIHTGQSASYLHFSAGQAAASSAKHLTIDRYGSVGIGKPMPSYKLDVAGIINADSILVKGQPLSASLDTWAKTGSDVHFTGGHVGIGTTTPNNLLVVEDTAPGSNKQVHFNLYNGNASEPLFLVENAHDGNVMRLSTNTTHDTREILEVNNGAGTQLVVKGDGKVGIGTLFPEETLHLAAGAATRLRLDSNSDTAFRLRHTTSSDDLLTMGTGGSDPRLALTGRSGQTGDYLRMTSAFGTAGDVMRVTATGQVGIGIDAPEHQLDVIKNNTGDVARFGRNLAQSIVISHENAQLGSAIEYRGADKPFDFVQNAATQDLRMVLRGTGDFKVVAGSSSLTPHFTVTESGNVGIGTTTPSKKLQITSSTNGNALRVEVPATNNTAYDFYLGNTEGNRYLRANPYVLEFINNGAPSVIRTVGSINDLELSATGDVVLQSSSGNVGIGTTNPSSKLAVDGTITSKEVVVTVDPVAWPDYVFEDDYDLRSLSEVEQFVEENGHLPEVPSAQEVSESGVAVGDMQATLLKKIEELTLYLLEQQRINKEHTARIDSLAQENIHLRQRMRLLEQD